MHKRTTPSEIGERVRKLRGMAEISARELDRLAGISESHTSLLERSIGDRISAKTALAIAKALGASLDWLLAGQGVEPSPEHVKESIRSARQSPPPLRPQSSLRAPSTLRPPADGSANTSART